MSKIYDSIEIQRWEQNKNPESYSEKREELHTMVLEKLKEDNKDNPTIDTTEQIEF